MPGKPAETTDEICLRTHLWKVLFWGILVAAFLIICIGLPLTHWIL